LAAHILAHTFDRTAIFRTSEEAAAPLAGYEQADICYLRHRCDEKWNARLD
jgi:hypothetical protein